MLRGGIDVVVVVLMCPFTPRYVGTLVGKTRGFLAGVVLWAQRPFLLLAPPPPLSLWAAGGSTAAICTIQSDSVPSANAVVSGVEGIHKECGFVLHIAAMT